LKGFLEKLENEKEKHAILFFLLGIFSGVALQWWIVAVAFFAISAMILRSLWVFGVRYNCSCCTLIFWGS